MKYSFQSFSGSGLVLVLHWVAGEQGHTLNEFSNPSNTGSYCDFTKERGKVRATISYLKYSKFRGDSCEGEFAWVAITKLRKYQPEETFSDIDTFWENLWQRWTCAGKILPICTFGWTETLKVDCSLGKTLEPMQRHHFLWPLEKRRIKYYYWNNLVNSADLQKVYLKFVQQYHCSCASL